MTLWFNVLDYLWLAVDMPKACPYVWANSCLDMLALFQRQFFGVVLQVNCIIYCVTLQEKSEDGER